MKTLRTLPLLIFCTITNINAMDHKQPIDDTDLSSALVTLQITDQYEKPKELLPVIGAHGATSLYAGWTALHIAVDHNCEKTATILCTAGADPNSRVSGIGNRMFDCTPLCIAVCLSRPQEILAALIWAGADPDALINKIDHCCPNENCAHASLYCNWGTITPRYIAQQHGSPSCIDLAENFLRTQLLGIFLTSNALPRDVNLLITQYLIATNKNAITSTENTDS